jgi:Domain of unknown function (DUF4340)
MRRHGWTLASLAVLIVLVGLQARLSGGPTQMEPDAPTGRLVPGLEDKLGSVSRIRLSEGDARIELCLAEQWHVCSQPLVPANRAKVRALLFALARIEIAEVQTREAGRFAALGLTRASPIVSLYDTNGAALLILTLGSLAEGTHDGRYGSEASRPWAYVLTGTPDLSARFADWADLPIPRLPLSSLSAITLEVPGAEPLELIRHRDRFARLDGGLTNEAAADGLVAALAALTPEAAATEPPEGGKSARLRLDPARTGQVRIDLMTTTNGLWLHYPQTPGLNKLWLKVPDFQAAMISPNPAAYRLNR